MLYAICLQPYIPMRAEAAEESEFVNQLLFGDTMTILEELPRWYRIRRDYDDYEGFIDIKTTTIITEDEHAHFLEEQQTASLMRLPFNEVARINTDVGGSSTPLHLPWGSFIYNLDDTGVTFKIFGFRYEIPSMGHVNPMTSNMMSRTACAKFLIGQAQMLLNTPYLWGGNSSFGVDCSGFIQTLFRFVAIRLPRNASQQAQAGEAVSFSDIMPGDLAFFAKPGSERISHVGLVIDKEHILHSSGSLHIDTLLPDGIWSANRNLLTHTFISARRLF